MVELCACCGKRLHAHLYAAEDFICKVGNLFIASQPFVCVVSQACSEMQTVKRAMQHRLNSEMRGRRTGTVKTCCTVKTCFLFCWWQSCKPATLLTVICSDQCIRAIPAGGRSARLRGGYACTRPCFRIRVTCRLGRPCSADWLLQPREPTTLPHSISTLASELRCSTST